MHCMAAAVCFWVNAITRETMDALVNKTYFHESVCPDDDHYDEDADVCVKEGHTCEADGSFLNFDLYCALGQMCTCQAKNEIAKNTFEIAPYLYPFTIEFNILIGKGRCTNDVC